MKVLRREPPICAEQLVECPVLAFVADEPGDCPGYRFRVVERARERVPRIRLRFRQALGWHWRPASLAHRGEQRVAYGRRVGRVLHAREYAEQSGVLVSGGIDEELIHQLFALNEFLVHIRSLAEKEVEEDVDRGIVGA